VNTLDPFGDHLSNVTPPWPTLLIGIYVSMAGAQTYSMHPQNDLNKENFSTTTSQMINGVSTGLMAHENTYVYSGCKK